MFLTKTPSSIFIAYHTSRLCGCGHGGDEWASEWALVYVVILPPWCRQWAFGPPRCCNSGIRNFTMVLISTLPLGRVTVALVPWLLAVYCGRASWVTNSRLRVADSDTPNPSGRRCSRVVNRMSTDSSPRSGGMDEYSGWLSEV